MGTFVAQLPALLGVLLGIAGTIIATSITDLARWKRDRLSRWDERRIDAYAEFARAVKDIHALSIRLAAHRMSVLNDRIVDRKAGLELLSQAGLTLTRVWETVLLLGDEPTVSAAREWRKAVERIENFARDSSDKDESAEWVTAVKAADELRDRFYLAARGSLDVQGGSVVQASWLPSATWSQAEAADS